MTTNAQRLFKKIVLHNKLLDEHALEDLLEEVPEPEEAIRHLVHQGQLPDSKGGLLLELYQKQLHRYGGESTVRKAVRFWQRRIRRAKEHGPPQYSGGVSPQKT